MLRALAITVAPQWPCAFISRICATSIEAGRPLSTPCALASAIPSSWGSPRKLVSNSANTPSMSRKHLPAAVPVSIGCSVALSAAPLTRIARTMSCKSPIERAGAGLARFANGPGRLCARSCQKRDSRDVRRPSRPSHHGGRKMLDGRRADLLHDAHQLGAQQFQHALDTPLAEGAKAPDVGPSDTDSGRAHAQRLADIGAAAEP